MYKKKKVKAKFKLRVELIAILSIVLLMVGVPVVLRLPDSNTKFANSFVEAGGSLTNEHVFKEMNLNEITKKIENSEELVFIYVGSTDCTESVSQISTINSRAAYWEVEQVIYYDVAFAVAEYEEDSDDETKQKEKMDSVELVFEEMGKLDTVENFIDLEYTPALWVFENGKLIFNSGDFLNDDKDGLRTEMNWSQIADRAFCVNLPNFEG